MLGPAATERWSDGVVATPMGDVPRVKTMHDARDRIGALKVRCDIGRSRYRVPPGLYAVGAPGAESLVFVLLSRTRARASRPATCRASSNGSIGSTPDVRAPWAALGWDCRS